LLVLRRLVLLGLVVGLLAPLLLGLSLLRCRRVLREVGFELGGAASGVLDVAGRVEVGAVEACGGEVAGGGLVEEVEGEGAVGGGGLLGVGEQE